MKDLNVQLKRFQVLVVDVLKAPNLNFAHEFLKEWQSGNKLEHGYITVKLYNKLLLQQTQ